MKEATQLLELLLLAVSGDELGIPHLLSPSQIADYHHEVFASHSISPHVFGGTIGIPTMHLGTLSVSPNSYSNLWCNGCDVK